MLIFLLVGAVSAAEPVSDVTMGDNTLKIASSCQNSQQDIDNNLTQNGDEIKTSSNNEKSFSDLQTTIDNLSDDNILDLNRDYKYTGTGNFAGITITKNNFTIDGHDHTLDANNQVRMFYVTGNV